MIDVGTKFAKVLVVVFHHYAAELERGIGDGQHRLEVEAALERTRHFVHAAIAQIGGGDQIEPRFGEHGAVFAQFRYGDDLFRNDRNKRVLDLGWTAGDLFKPDD